MLEMLNVALIRCPAGIATENDKNSQIFSKFLHSFHQSFERLFEFEKFKGPTRKRFVAQQAFSMK